MDISVPAIFDSIASYQALMGAHESYRLTGRLTRHLLPWICPIASIPRLESPSNTIQPSTKLTADIENSESQLGFAVPIELDTQGGDILLTTAANKMLILSRLMTLPDTSTATLLIDDTIYDVGNCDSGGIVRAS
jgi:hypothetical protein